MREHSASSRLIHSHKQPFWLWNPGRLTAGSINWILSPPCLSTIRFFILFWLFPTGVATADFPYTSIKPFIFLHLVLLLSPACMSSYTMSKYLRFGLPSSMPSFSWQSSASLVYFCPHSPHPDFSHGRTTSTSID